MEERSGLTIKDLLIRLILIIIFIFLLIWLFPMPDLKPLNNQIFADNIDRMKDVAKSYYTVERLPENINDSKRMTLREMIDKHLILPLMDSNGKYCSEDDSYIEITKMENEYVIKVYLSCTDKKDYIIEHFGCYDICSDTCKMLETTSKSGYAGDITTKRKTTKKTSGKVTTTKNKGKIYEYQFVKNVCTEKFEKYVCPSGYYLAGDTCIKNGSKVITVDAHKKTSTVTSTDTKDAKPIINTSTDLIDATCRTDYLTSTQDATAKPVMYNAIATTTTQKVTANKVTSYDVKGAVANTTTIDADYEPNYDVITADKVVSSYKWSYDYTLVDTNGSLAYVKDNERLDFVTSWDELECSTCFTTVTKYKYYHYVKKPAEYKYTCDAYPGYSLYDGDKCRKKLSTSKCPAGYSPNGSVCSKKITTYSCSKYGSDYKLDSNAKTCTKTITTYNCNGIGDKTSDPKYCTRKITKYSCPAGTTDAGNNKCKKIEYSCPPNTSTKTYTLNGTKCTVKSKVKVCSCPSGTVQTSDKLHCAKTNSSTTYTCEDYPGYTLNGKKCTKTTSTQKITYTCDKGYTLDGTKCVKTVSTSDSKKAEKKYKTTCEQKYKWSTKTSIDGWTYTGNKRQIN